ncbi:unnamed protein product, partial [Chrysoparadoxa australica]
ALQKETEQLKAGMSGTGRPEKCCCPCLCSQVTEEADDVGVQLGHPALSHVDSGAASVPSLNLVDGPTKYSDKALDIDELGEEASCWLC